MKDSTIATDPKSVALRPTYPFALKGSSIDFSSQNNFNFLKSDFKKLQPVNDSITLGIASLKAFLEKGNNTLKITGFATKDEINASIFPNLGHARANDVKNYFIAQGIPSSKIDIDGVITEGLATNNETVLGPISYNLIEKNISEPAPETDWKAVKEGLNTNPLTLYFNTGQTQIDLTESDRQKIADMIHYIDHVENAKLIVVGYTDNVGNRETNIHLGQQRADFAKNYLIQNGVTSDKINSSSKGPDDPLMSNATKEGQAKNRRTVIKIN
ncbi:OmpA family protein [Flavobacterium cerinum]|uniref:OmpA family protein n=1 Tax=Flavobacterium cerinum TaxID=2502784 RepID=A0ABY5IT88_9FLAO|nr:OmpA family protein [Flavobacterium cerinum]UUC45869.1 OmpA family protein [Flavobacterium cerinum]